VLTQSVPEITPKKKMKSDKIMNKKTVGGVAGLLTVILLGVASVSAAEKFNIKPVKVYPLAGQSNRVGMGDLTGARPLYPSVWLEEMKLPPAGEMK